MKQYLDLMQKIVDEGIWQENRTGIRTKMIPGAMMQFDLQKGFPAITTKKLAFNAVKGELIGFLRGCTSAAEFRELGCKIWDQNANENEAWVLNPYRQGEDDLGYIYSRLWTDMPIAGKPTISKSNRLPNEIDRKWNQIEKLIENIRVDPTSRRMIVSAWHPEVFYKAALPPCHVLFQVIIEQKTEKMHMTMYQRSCDFFLGVPFNIASYSLLLHMISWITGYKPGTFTWFGADVHLYENHMDQVLEQLTREPKPLPKLAISKRMLSGIKDFNPEDLILTGYDHYPALKAPMAV